MGLAAAKNPVILTDKEMKILINTTGMTEDEIHTFHRDFIVKKSEFEHMITNLYLKRYLLMYLTKADHPGGFIREDEFINVYEQLYHYGHPERIAKLAFRLFDRDGNGKICFSEFLVASSMTGCLEANSHKQFKTGIQQGLDIYESENLDRKELEHVIYALYGHDGYGHEESRKKADEMLGDDHNLSKDLLIKYIMSDKNISKTYSINND